MSTQKTFSISPTSMVAKEWDGVTDTNGNGVLSYADDAVKNFEITSSQVVYYNADGTPSVTVNVDGTVIH